MSVFDWFKKRTDRSPFSGASLLRFRKEEVRHLLVDRHGLPQVDWGMADLWLMQRAEDDEDPKRSFARRAIAAAWLEQLRDALEEDHQAWRGRDIEGLTPMSDVLGKRIAEVAARADREIRRALKPIRGDLPIPPYALVAIKPLGAYVSFKAHFGFSDESTATSGGFYSRAEGGGFPTLAINCAAPWGAELVLAHELTHHALAGADLPLWAEEGITQMMEERVCSVSNFTLSRERVSEQRERWAEDGLEMFVAGEAHSSPDGNDQELAYHMSQWVVRSAMEQNPTRFFQFLCACRGSDPELVAKSILGSSQTDFVRAVCGIP